MIAAGVPFFPMLVTVMIAFYLGIEGKSICKECVDRLIAGTADTAKELDSRTGKCHLCPSSEPPQINVSTFCSARSPASAP